MASCGLDEDEAFLMLKKASQSGHRKRRDISTEIVAAGEAPESLPG